MHQPPLPLRSCFFLSTVDPVKKITRPRSPTKAFSALSNGIIWAECKGEGAITKPMPAHSATLVPFRQRSKAGCLFPSSLMRTWVALSMYGLRHLAVTSLNLYLLNVLLYAPTTSALPSAFLFSYALLYNLFPSKGFRFLHFKSLLFHYFEIPPKLSLFLIQMPSVKFTTATMIGLI